MLLNVFVFAVVGVMTYTWWKQGLFSAVIHLVLTVISGALAFGLWDLVVYKGLIDVVPEYAWGVGLLAPFAIILFVLRALTDKFIPGDLQISNMGNMIGGGACGFVSGVLVAGLLVIGLQMAGLPKLLGYTGWALSEQGEPGRGLTATDATTASSLILPVDNIAARFFSYLCDGAFAPLSSSRSFGRVHPQIDIASAFFVQGEFPESRRAIRKDNLSIADEGKAYYRVETVPESFGKGVVLRPSEELVVVGAEVMVRPLKRKGASDGDGIFRVKRPQVNLVYDHEGETKLLWPYGYIQEGEFVAIKQDYIYSEPGSKVVHYWVFMMPKGAEPYGIQLKNTMAVLPATPNDGGVEAIAKLVTYHRTGGDEAFRVDQVAQDAAKETMEEPDISVEASKEIAELGEKLPFMMSVNQLGTRGVEYDPDTKKVIKGQASVEREQGVGRENGISEFTRAISARLVQVKLGSNEPKSLLGKVMQTATNNTQSPILRDDRGEIHLPVGYTITRGARTQFYFDLADSIRTLSQVPLARTSADDDVRLIYHVGANRRIVSFELGPNKKQPLNLEIVEKKY